jgi:hypothetical protein
LPLSTSRAVASVLAGAAAFALVAFATRPPGPGLDPDAASYVGAAASFVRTGAFRIPTSGWAASDTTEALAHFPPGFPMAIAGPIALGVSPVQSARIVVAISAFVTATVIGLALDTTALGLLAVAVVFLTPAIVDMHLSVLSEPLFLALLVSALVFMQRTDWIWRLALGLVGAAAVMVRYAGVGIVVAAAVWVVTRRGVAWRQRLRDLALVSLPAVIVLRIWTSRNAEIRRIASYGHFGATLRVGANTVADWLAPGITAPAVRWAVAVVIAAIAIVTVVRAWRSRPIIWAAALIGVSLAAITIASRLRADPNIPFDERILAPGFLLAELATVAALGQAPRIAKFLLGAWVVASAVVSTGAIKNALDDGNDFASSDWRYSPTVAWVRDSASGRTIYTNWPVALYFQAGRSSHSLPPVLEPLTLRRFGDRLVRTHALMVAFDIPSPDAAPPDSIAERLRLRRVARLDDGTVWELANPGDATRPVASGSP